jgi:hypothetical protein
MEPWTGAQRVFAVKAFYKNSESLVIAQREFRREFGIHHNRAVPSTRAIKTWVQNFCSVEPVASKFRTQVLMAWADGTLFEIHAEQSSNCHRFCKTLSQQKHVALQSMAPLQLKGFKGGSKMAIAVSAPVLQNQKKTVLQNRLIH